VRLSNIIVLRVLPALALPSLLFARQASTPARRRICARDRPTIDAAEFEGGKLRRAESTGGPAGDTGAHGLFEHATLNSAVAIDLAVAIGLIEYTDRGKRPSASSAIALPPHESRWLAVKFRAMPVKASNYLLQSLSTIRLPLTLMVASDTNERLAN